MLSSRFLQNTSRQQILDAIALNHSCFYHQIEESNGEDAFRSGNYDWSPRPHHRMEAAIPYPRYDPLTLSSDLDRYMEQCRRQGIQVVSVQTLEEDSKFLAPFLMAQGFGSGGSSHWMILDIPRMSENFQSPDELLVEIIENETEWLQTASDDIPNRKLQYQEPSPSGDRRRFWHFGAWLGDAPVGNVQLLMTRGPLGVAGLYNLGVIPDAKNRGIGKALLRAACRFAKDLGCQYAILNVDKDSRYRDLGFEPEGRGHSWWAQEPEIDTPPTPETVAFVEAVGRGNTVALDDLPSSSLPDDMDHPLPCGLTPLGIAAATHQPESAEWLLHHGATPDLALLWYLGWKERIPEYLSRQPELVNRRFSEEKKTPLHEAVWRDDVDFARFLLDHGADPTLEDEGFQSTPLGWAQYLGKDDLAQFLEDYLSSKSAD